MGEPTMEEYMTKTRDDYGSGIVRPKIDDKTRFELKGQFLKELQDNTFSGSDNEDAKLKRQILDSKGVIPSMNVVDAKKAIQEMADHSQKLHNEMSTRTRSTDTSDGLAVIQAQLNNLGREIKKVNEKVYAAQAGCESCKGPHYTKDCPLKEEVKAFEEAFYTHYGVPFPPGGRFRAAALGFYQRDNENPRASIKALEIQIGQMSKVLQESGSGSLPGSTETNPRDHVKLVSTTIETDTTSIRRIGGARYAVLDNQNRMQTFKPNQSTIPFPSRLTDDCYDEMNELDSTTYGIF
ncbi:hypothetical protein Tco_1285525 [Tanacetum coccineum]